ncbi:ParA family protein [Deinococcus sp.]|uniref:ParA family protein n=1 Tax=Deinococcus sp. TaxID=47478 RepID=UPI003B5BFA95
MHVLVVTNLSGGEGKTTVVREVGFALSQMGFRVALIDADPQATLTKSLGLHLGDGQTSEDDLPAMQLSRTIFFSLADNRTPLPPPLNVHGVDLWPANKSLARADGMLYTSEDALGNLRVAVQQLDYDFVLIDTTPVRTALLHAAVAAADGVIVPVSDAKGLENLGELVEVLQAARKFSFGLEIRLFVPNRQKANLNYHKKIQASLKELSEVYPVSPVVGDRSAPLGLAREAGLPAVLHRPNSEVASEFRAVATALLTALNLPMPEVRS